MAGEQIFFFRKNYLDISNENATTTASQGADFTDLVRNRNNISCWVTTGSVDADNTTFTVNFNEAWTLNFILLVKHNFKNYTVKYWDGSAYQHFPTAINVSNNTDETTFYEFSATSTTKIQITITGTMTANDDKFLYQLIAGQKIGQLDGWPMIKKPIVSRNRVISKMLSGKQLVRESIGFFSCRLSVKCWKDTSDLDIVEELYSENDGFLVWLCGNSEAQFSSPRFGYRKEDIYLMKCTNEYTPEWHQGIYSSGLKLDLDLVEVVD